MSPIGLDSGASVSGHHPGRCTTTTPIFTSYTGEHGVSSSKSFLVVLAVASLASGGALGEHGALGGSQPETITLDAQGGDYARILPV